MAVAKEGYLTPNIFAVFIFSIAPIGTLFTYYIPNSNV